MEPEPKKEDVKEVKEVKPKEVKEIPLGTVEDFIKMDIRVGEITECWKHPESENLYCEKINIGDEIRQIGSGMQKFVKLENMKGLVCVLTNLKPRKLAGFESNGMVLAASSSDHTAVELLRPAEGSKVGERVSLEECDKITQEKQVVLNPKHKILEKCLPVMKTDDNLFATFNGKKLTTSAGFITSQTLKSAHIS